MCPSLKAVWLFGVEMRKGWNYAKEREKLQQKQLNPCSGPGVGSDPDDWACMEFTLFCSTSHLQ